MESSKTHFRTIACSKFLDFLEQGGQLEMFWKVLFQNQYFLIAKIQEKI
jgi:hypothetical protein